MKKIIVLISLILLTIISVSKDLSKKQVIIPNDSIRFRVVANSNSKNDQLVKQKVKTSLEKELIKVLKNTNNINDARISINNNIINFKEQINKTINSDNYTITYGNNYFPSKNYRGLIYKGGNYESLVIKIGKAEGNNFWCVLFPPLCMIDEKSKKNTDIEYHLLVKDLIDKYL